MGFDFPYFLSANQLLTSNFKSTRFVFLFCFVSNIWIFIRKSCELFYIFYFLSSFLFYSSFFFFHFYSFFLILFFLILSLFLSWFSFYSLGITRNIWSTLLKNGSQKFEERKKWNEEKHFFLFSKAKTIPVIGTSSTPQKGDCFVLFCFFFSYRLPKETFSFCIKTYYLRELFIIYPRILFENKADDLMK